MYVEIWRYVIIKAVCMCIVASIMLKILMYNDIVFVRLETLYAHLH